MKEFKMYLCEKCGETYNNSIDAEECEKNHILPKCICMDHFHYNSPNNANPYISDTKYPKHIRVVMENGEIVTYYLNRLKADPSQ